MFVVHSLQYNSRLIESFTCTALFALHLRHQLHDVLVANVMFDANVLRLVFRTRTPYVCELKLLVELLMQLIANI